MIASRTRIALRFHRVELRWSSLTTVLVPGRRCDLRLSQDDPISLLSHGRCSQQFARVFFSADL